MLQARLLYSEAEAAAAAFCLGYWACSLRGLELRNDGDVTRSLATLGFL